MATAQVDSSTTAAFVNPIISATLETFEMMLGVVPKRTGLQINESHTPTYDVSAMISMTGQIKGTIVFSVAGEAALNIFEQLIGDKSESLNEEVCDAIGEVSNMIAGSAKAKLAELELSLGLPTMVMGRDHRIHYPDSVARPIQLLFESDLGPFTLEFGFAKED